MIKIKAKNWCNSRAIPRFFNVDIDYFGLNLIGHDLFRGSLDETTIRVDYILTQSII